MPVPFRKVRRILFKRCLRYLYESGCVGMCVNLCKAPCQAFFTEQLGMPLTMNPSPHPPTWLTETPMLTVQISKTRAAR